jgi:hypothetical protein
MPIKPESKVCPYKMETRYVIKESSSGGRASIVYSHQQNNFTEFYIKFDKMDRDQLKYIADSLMDIDNDLKLKYKKKKWWQYGIV